MGRNGSGSESTNREKFQPVPVSTKRERNTDPADSGKKVVPGAGVKRFRVFLKLWQQLD